MHRTVIVSSNISRMGGEPGATWMKAGEFLVLVEPQSDDERDRLLISKAPLWREGLARFEQPDLRLTLWQLANTFLPFFGLIYLMYRSLSGPYLLTLALAIPTAGLSVRIFAILHDCAHGALFKSRSANLWVGHTAAFLTLVPFYRWRHQHSQHHAHRGNLDEHDPGDIWTMTVRQFRAAPRYKQLIYRTYRSPLVLFGIGPVLAMALAGRFPGRGLKRRERINVHLTNLGLAGALFLMHVTIGLQAFVAVYLPVFALAATTGVWLMYVQHQFDSGYYESGEKWDYVQSALRGSSYYRLPAVLQWFAGNLGFHHIHHLSPRVPNYYLAQCHQENPIFHQVREVTLRDSLKCMRYRLWDEESERLVGFDHLSLRPRY